VRRLATVVVGIAALCACLVPTAAASNGASNKRACNSINLGGPRVFFKHNMRCERAKHYARRLYKTDGRDEPRRFNCHSGSNFNQGASCQHKSKNKGFGWHPADKRKVDLLDEYCSPSGDYCLDVTRRRGRVKLEIATFGFRGRYELCVRGPEGKGCKDFRLSKDEGDIYSDRVDWERKFEDQGPGRYKAVWKKFGRRLGERLRFHP
jgi:hypothetical protein